MADLALLPNVLWTPDGGELENAIDGVRATMTGGVGGAWTEESNWQTLLGAKAPVIAEATDNLLADDVASFEDGGTTGWAASNYNLDVVETGWHGSKSLRGIATAANPYFQANVTLITAAATLYTASLYVRANNVGGLGATVFARLDDNVATGPAGDSVTLTYDWQRIQVSHTFNAASVSRVLRVLSTAGLVAGDEVCIDAIQLEAKAYATPFALGSRTASTMTFPTPFTAGEPVSFLIFVWTPWVGDDGVDHYFFDTLKNSYRVMMYKSAAGPHLWMYLACPFPSERYARIAVDSTNWSAGFHIIASSLDETGKPRIALDGVLGSSQSGLGREVELADNMSIGSSLSGTNPLNGIILPFIYRGVAWGDEECEYMSSGAVTPYSPDRSAMYCHHPNKAIYALKAPYQYIDARRDN